MCHILGVRGVGSITKKKTVDAGDNLECLPRWHMGKESACNAGDPGLMPGLGRSPRERNGHPLQYSCLENPMDKGDLWAIVHGVKKTWTQPSTHK